MLMAASEIINCVVQHQNIMHFAEGQSITTLTAFCRASNYAL